MGFTDCSSLHNENRARFCMATDQRQLDIYAHCYAGGIRVEQYIGRVNLNQENRYEIVVTEGQYIFYLNGEQRTAFERRPLCEAGGNYILFPYFAEPVPAPHDMRVHIEMLD